MTVYYNEIDHAAVVWLEALIKEKLIPYGHVDDRDIRDVRPNDLRGFSQCHFFAGIGGWPLALRLAGLDDRRGIWTGSCPCQPFSSAGFGKGFADERHLWPFWFHLIRVCRPDLIYLEQVASSAGTQWIDLVSDDVQGEGFAIGALDFPSAGVGSPNARQRFYAAVELADAERQRRERREGRLLRGQDQGARGEAPEGRPPRFAVDRLGQAVQLAGWHTPMAGTPAQNGNNPAGNTDSSRKTVALAQADAPARLTATGELLIGSDAGTIYGVPLNPEHSRWLQAYPSEWSKCAVMGMQSTSRLRKRSSKHTKPPENLYQIALARLRG